MKRLLLLTPSVVAVTLLGCHSNPLVAPLVVVNPNPIVFALEGNNDRIPYQYVARWHVEVHEAAGTGGYVRRVTTTVRTTGGETVATIVDVGATGEASCCTFSGTVAANGKLDLPQELLGPAVHWDALNLAAGWSVDRAGRYPLRFHVEVAYRDHDGKDQTLTLDVDEGNSPQGGALI